MEEDPNSVDNRSRQDKALDMAGDIQHQQGQGGGFNKEKTTKLTTESLHLIQAEEAIPIQGIPMEVVFYDAHDSYSEYDEIRYVL